MSRIVCATSGCGAFYLDDDIETVRRRDHRWFYCPGGHKQYFPGKTAEEMKIELQERAITDLSRLARQCPWPGCWAGPFDDRRCLGFHMIRVHVSREREEVEP